MRENRIITRKKERKKEKKRKRKRKESKKRREGNVIKKGKKES